MSMSGAAVTSIPPEWIERWRGKPSMRAHSSSQRSQSDRPATEPSWRPTSAAAARRPGRARRRCRAVLRRGDRLRARARRSASSRAQRRAAGVSSPGPALVVGRVGPLVDRPVERATRRRSGGRRRRRAGPSAARRGAGRRSRDRSAGRARAASPATPACSLLARRRRPGRGASGRSPASRPARPRPRPGASSADLPPEPGPARPRVQRSPPMRTAGRRPRRRAAGARRTAAAHLPPVTVLRGEVRPEPAAAGVVELAHRVGQAALAGERRGARDGRLLGHPRSARSAPSTPSPGRAKNSANPPSASRSRRTITLSYVSSAFATRSTSGRGNPSA